MVFDGVYGVVTVFNGVLMLFDGVDAVLWCGDAFLGVFTLFDGV